MKCSSNLVANVALTVASTVVVSAVLYRFTGTGRIFHRAAAESTPSQTTRVTPFDVVLNDAPRKGDPSARVVIIEYSDFECPFCRRYVANTYGRLRAEFIDSGQVQYVFRHFPLAIHDHAKHASQAAECARHQGRFWEMHDRLFASQHALTLSELIDSATAIGLSVKAFRGCLGGRVAPEIERDISEGQRLGIRGTPTFLVGQLNRDRTVHVVSMIHGSQPLTAFETALTDLLGHPPLKSGD